VRRVAAVAAVAAVACVAAPAGGASGSEIAFLRTPTGNIMCGLTWGTGPAQLRCDILSGLRPMPPRPASCEFDWGAGYRLNRTGRARVSCVSDSVASRSARVLRYGTTWRRLGFACTSKRTGLTCVNSSKHGFLLSRRHSFRF
jgi:uncharacterized protein DUF6636